jgi:YD repeat-containing protein
MGRRLKKKFTYHNGSNTDVTTYKYHYIGGQITEIEIDSIRNPGESQTVIRDEEVKIHLGANSQPISYEWVKHVGGNTTQATYYYHYDIHGNVLKVTDSSENTKITYTYDVLGKILTETNPDSILNFFTFRGASQTIWDSEVGMYYSGGYYRPDTGTALQGTGAPVLTNPASGAMLNAVAQATSANAQLAAHAMVSATTAGATGGGSPGNFAPPPGPSDGFAHAGNQGPPPTTESVEPTLTTCDINGVNNNSDFPLLIGMFECDCGSEKCSQCKGERRKVNQDAPISDESKKVMAEAYLRDVGNGVPTPWCSAIAEGLGLLGFDDLGKDIQDDLINQLIDNGLAKDRDEAICILRRADWLAFAFCSTEAKWMLMGLKYDGEAHFFYGPNGYDARKGPPQGNGHDNVIPGREVKKGDHVDSQWFANSWGRGGSDEDALLFVLNKTGSPISELMVTWDYIDEKNGKRTLYYFLVLIPKGTGLYNASKMISCDARDINKSENKDFLMFGDYRLQEGDKISFYHDYQARGRQHLMTTIFGGSLEYFYISYDLSPYWEYVLKIGTKYGADWPIKVK